MTTLLTVLVAFVIGMGAGIAALFWLVSVDARACARASRRRAVFQAASREVV